MKSSRSWKCAPEATGAVAAALMIVSSAAFDRLEKTTANSTERRTAVDSRNTSVQ